MTGVNTADSASLHLSRSGSKPASCSTAASANRIPLRISIGLSTTAFFTCLALLGGISVLPQLWSELLLCTAGSVCAVIGSAVVATHPPGTRMLMLAVVATTAGLISWSFWAIEYLGWYGNGSAGFIYQNYKQLPLPKWKYDEFATLTILSLTILVLVLCLLKLLTGFISSGIRSHKIAFRSLLVSVAAILLSLRIVQMNFQNQLPVTVGNYFFWLLPSVFVLMCLMILATYCPKQKIVSTSLWIATLLTGIGVESMFCSPLLKIIPGFGSLSVAIGFMTTAVWLASTASPSPVDTRVTPFRRIVARMAICLPFVLFATGYVWSNRVDTIALLTGRNSFSEAMLIAELRGHGVIVDTNNGQSVVRVRANAAPDSLKKLVESLDGENAILWISGFRTDLQLPRIDSRLAPRLNIIDGQVSVDQLAGMLETFDVNLDHQARIVPGSFTDYYDRTINGALTIEDYSFEGSPSNLSALRKKIDMLKGIVFAELSLVRRSYCSSEPEDWSDVAELALAELKGESLSLHFRYLSEKQSEIPSKIVPNWKHVSFHFHEVESLKRPIRFLECIGSDCEKSLEFGRGILASVTKPAIASAGLRPWRFPNPWPSELNSQTTSSFSSLFGMTDESTPDSIFVLNPESPLPEGAVPASSIRNLYFGKEWSGLDLSGLDFLRMIPSRSLEPFTSVQRLGFGTEQVDSYGFLSRMPDLRELQIADERLPGPSRELAKHLAALPRLEKYMRVGLPAETEIAALARVKTLREVVLFGIEQTPPEIKMITALKQKLPGVELRIHSSCQFLLEQPPELKQYRQRLLDEVIRDAFQE